MARWAFNGNFRRIIMWVARDENTKLWLFINKPIRSKNILGYWGCIGECMELDSELFPDLKWEDEPIEVRLIRY